MKTDQRDKYTVPFGSRAIPVALHRRDRKSIRIVVSPNLRVDAYVPVRAKPEEVDTVLKKKAAWTARKLEWLESFHPLPRQSSM